MAIMTGVQSAQVLGPSTQRQAEKSRRSLNGEDVSEFDASENVGGDTAAWESDGGRDAVDKHNGVDVIR
jgi:cell division protein FtsZ